MESDLLRIAKTLPPSKRSKSYEENRLRTRTYRRRNITEPYICPTCKKVWQHLGATNEYMEYVDRFPKIGCSKRVCKQCKNL